MGAPSQVLVSAKWLSDMVKRNLVGPRLRILDTSWYLPMMKRDGRKEFAQAHIAGASFFDIDECVDPASKFDHTLPSPDIFADYVGNLGVGNNSHVVVYDASDFGSFTCTRVWWMFRFFGHSNVSVLNGGLRNWVREGHPVTAAHSRQEWARFTATRNHPSWVKSFEDVTRNIREQEFQVVDVRPHQRFLGKEPEPREGVQSGHIPGSKCMPFFGFLDDEGMFLSTEKLKQFFEMSQVDLKKPLCGSCGSGVTACHMVLAAHLCGAPGASVYDGSWYEWFTKAPPEHVVSQVKSQL
ncbi:thiosulfate sulfurtransferase-like [Takifugu flavidus]|uniref:thiosulfate sulfurtransferase-like n=1 Tax=Takifugu flavidus TaxID=433684 RepID=UPI002544C2BD|nr:thiosulfate sulfurtransferase-like [Takifugu flavidus]